MDERKVRLEEFALAEAPKNFVDFRFLKRPSRSLYPFHREARCCNPCLVSIASLL